MKKSIVFLVLVVLLTSCFGESDDVTKAKQELGIIDGGEPIQESIAITTVDDNNGEETIEIPTMGDLMDIKGDPRIKITQISGETLLALDDLEYSDFKSGYSKITGTTRGQVDKIIVSFSNDESEYPSDGFTLTKFNPGDSTFEYNASSKFKVLDFGINKYRFVAYSGNDVSTLELLVVVSEDDTRVLENNGDISAYEQEIEDSSEEGLETFVEAELPVGSDYGNVVKLGEDSFTYSDIKGLEVNKEVLGNITCEINEQTGDYYVTNLLAEKQASWYYWNTCRDIVKGKGISFFVTRLQGDNYIYEKHYLDTNHGLYGTYELEKGTGATSDNLNDTNKLLKEKNADYTQLEVVDELFRKIVD